MFGNIGWSELILIFFIILLLFGAKRLPEIGKAMGKAIMGFKKGLKEAKKEIDEEIEEDDEGKKSHK